MSVRHSFRWCLPILGIWFGLSGWLGLSAQPAQAQIWSDAWVSYPVVTMDRGGPVRNFFGRIHDRWHSPRFYTTYGIYNWSTACDCYGFCCCEPFWYCCSTPVIYYPTPGYYFGLGSNLRLDSEYAVVSSFNSRGNSDWVPAPSPTPAVTPSPKERSILEDIAPQPSTDELHPPSTDTRESIEMLRLQRSTEIILASQEMPIKAPVVAPHEWMLDLTVPADAQVEINGRLTRSIGTIRKFTAHLSKRENEKPVKVRVTVKRDGELLAYSKEFSPRGGGWLHQSISETDLAPALTTTLIVSAPADSRLTLAGKSFEPGELTRIFTTTRLAEGEVWSGYQVQAELEVDGKTVLVERFLEVVAGQEHFVDLFPLLENRAMAQK